MNDAMTNFQLGKLQHKTYNAWAAGRRENRQGPKPNAHSGNRLVWPVIGACLVISWVLASLV